jgi:hypothetical protein
MKRHLVFPLDFDTRALALEDPNENWEETSKRLHLANRERLIVQLKIELGEQGFEQKLQNFKDAGTSPFSILSHHNGLYRQARYAFIHGLYYPALTSACALGERMLNHLILDLRDSYKSTPIYREIHRSKSFQDWGKAIHILSDWNVFQHPDVESKFHELKELRMRSIHFNPETYVNLRAEALAALFSISEIIQLQFGFAQRWLIPNTAGAFFIRMECEEDPFIAQYYLPQCPKVTPYYIMRHTIDGRWAVFDWENYEGVVNDGEFARMHGDRTEDQLVPDSVPLEENVHVQLIGR